MIAAASNQMPRMLDNTNESVFFEKPAGLYTIDEDSRTAYASSQKIQTLIKELKEKGPLVAIGQIGPTVYVDAPVKMQNAKCDQEIWGWKPQAQRSENSSSVHVIVLGAEIVEGREFVYYTSSEDRTTDRESYIRQHRASPRDAKIYKCSHEKFSNYLTDLYPPVAVKPAASNNVEKSKKTADDFVQELCAIMPLDSILLDRSVEERCKSIGQQIFDQFKDQSGGKSIAGKQACQSICESVRKKAPDGRLRSEYISRAWNRIGDSNERWMA